MKKCSRCKHSLSDESFVYNNKTHKICESCSIKQKKKCNICEICGIFARFNKETETHGIRCQTHKEIGMINVSTKKCKFMGCSTVANFNFEGMKNRKFCSKHKEEGMVDIINKKCQFTNCKKLPTFNFEGMIERKFCAEHKEEGMINLRDICQFLTCTKMAIFNFEGLAEGKTKGKFCSEHKEQGMINVKDKTCEFAKCQKKPTFNFIGISQPKFCAEHKEDSMINVKDKKCQYINCKKIPYFNFEGNSNGVFCSEHKEKDMIDVKSRRCKKCHIRAIYGVPFNFPTCCVTHKEDGMIRHPKARCRIRNCDEYARFGNDIIKKRPLHCELHKTINDMDFAERLCFNCGATDILDSNNLCVSVCGTIETWNKYKKYQKNKENRMNKVLDTYVGIPYSKDIKIGDCKGDLQRPDRVHDFGSHWLVIECDESQHEGKSQCAKYDTKQDEDIDRMKNLYNVFAGIENRPLIFIRYNPDNYRVNNILQKTPLQKREEILVRWINHFKSKTIDYFIDRHLLCGVIYLFYDDYNEHETDIICLY